MNINFFFFLGTVTLAQIDVGNVGPEDLKLFLLLNL